MENRSALNEYLVINSEQAVFKKRTISPFRGVTVIASMPYFGAWMFLSVNKNVNKKFFQS